MKLRNVIVIARKEFKDVLRDRRTLVFMLLLPIAVLPLLGIGISKFARKTLQAKQAEVLNVAVNDEFFYRVDPRTGELRLDPETGRPMERDRNLIEELAQIWRLNNRFELGVAFGKLGLESADISNDADALADRLDKIQEVRQSGGDAMGDAALVSMAKAYVDLKPSEQQVLADFGAIQGATRRMKYIPYSRVKTEGQLAAGVEIPEDLPPPLGEPRFALSIQRAEPIHAALHLPAEVEGLIGAPDLTEKVHILHDSSISRSEEAHARLSAFFETLGKDLLDLRVQSEGFPPAAFLSPITLEQGDVATRSRRFQAAVGGILPYLIIMFCFFGAFYPSLDLTAGEKERHTLETLLLAPVSRVELAWGKFVVVFAASIVAVVLALLSAGLTITKGILPQGIASQFNLSFEPLAIAVTASLFIPVAALFSALLLAVALLARSFKEAQSYTAPLQFLVILPAMSALLPDLQAETKMAWIPFVNVSLLMREQLKGNYLWDFYAITLGSMVVLTLLVLWGAGQVFKRETVLLRT